eukprot:1145376-Pelagomonas_calceolata.AAC.4
MEGQHGCNDFKIRGCPNGWTPPLILWQMGVNNGMTSRSKVVLKWLDPPRPDSPAKECQRKNFSHITCSFLHHHRT